MTWDNIGGGSVFR